MVHCLFHVDCEWLLCYMIFILFLLTTFFLLKDGQTALHYAAFYGFEQIVKILVEHGANVLTTLGTKPTLCLVINSQEKY